MSAKTSSPSVIVVGGAGYIGSHVCKAFAQQGIRPITFDNLSTGHKHAVKWGPLIEVDLCNRAAIFKEIEKHAYVPLVIHLASSIEVGIGEKHPDSFYMNNVVGALNLLDAMKNSGIDQIIFSSTCATYGEILNLPINENELQSPYSVYGKTKLAIEHMLQSYHKAFDLNYVTLRYFNAAGADESGEIGEEHDPETHLIPLALASAAGLRDRMKIFGDDYDTPDGTCIRDYIHVNDIAQAHLLSWDKLQNGLTKAEVNIGTGKGYSNLEILKTIEKITGLPMPYDIEPKRTGDLSQLFADTSRAESVLGFEAKYSDLEFIVSTAWQFFENKHKI